MNKISSAATRGLLALRTIRASAPLSGIAQRARGGVTHLDDYLDGLGDAVNEPQIGRFLQQWAAEANPSNYDKLQQALQAKLFARGLGNRQVPSYQDLRDSIAENLRHARQASHTERTLLQAHGGNLPGRYQ